MAIFIVSLLPTSNLLAHGDLHERIASLSRSIKAQPADGNLFLQRGELYRLHAEPDLAIGDYCRALRLDATLDLAQLGMARAWLDMGKPIEARANLESFLTKHPRNAEALLVRARILAIQGEARAAAADYTGALGALSRPAPEIFLERAAVLSNEGLIDEAIAGLDEGVTRLGYIAPLELRAVELELGRQRYDSALARLNGQIERAPRKEFLLCRRGAILEKAGRLSEAHLAYTAASRELETLPPAQRANRALSDLSDQILSALERISPRAEEPQSKRKERRISAEAR